MPVCVSGETRIVRWYPFIGAPAPAAPKLPSEGWSGPAPFIVRVENPSQVSEPRLSVNRSMAVAPTCMYYTISQRQSVQWVGRALPVRDL
jgi:hypothetical protein